MHDGATQRHGPECTRTPYDVFLLDCEPPQHGHVRDAAGISERICRHPIAERVAVRRVRGWPDLAKPFRPQGLMVRDHMHKEHVAGQCV